jgi:hypothetical protein
MLPHFDNDRVRATEAIVRAFRDWLTDTSDGRALLKRARQELRGHNLACWCPPGPCHCDIWLKLVNR